MIVKKHDNHTTLEDEKNDLADFVSYLNHKIPHQYSEDNLIIDLLKYNSLSQEDLLLFLPLSNEQRADKKSFVLVNNSVGVDDIPDELCVVPTLLEAGDIIEMEKIERELGF